MLPDLTSAIASVISLFASYFSQRSLRQAARVEIRLTQQLKDVSDKLEQVSEQLEQVSERLARFERRHEKRKRGH